MNCVFEIKMIEEVAKAERLERERLAELERQKQEEMRTGEYFATAVAVCETIINPMLIEWAKSEQTRWPLKVHFRERGKNTFSPAQKRDKSRYKSHARDYEIEYGIMFETKMEYIADYLREHCFNVKVEKDLEYSYGSGLVEFDVLTISLPKK